MLTFEGSGKIQCLSELKKVNTDPSSRIQYKYCERLSPKLEKQQTHPGKRKKMVSPKSGISWSLLGRTLIIMMIL